MKKRDLAYQVSLVTIIVNLILTIFKLFAGIIGNSKAMISDAIHSASDVLSTIIVIIGIYISKKAPDQKHQYGHERFECLAAIILAVILTFTGISIGFSGITNILNGSNTKIPSLLPLIAAILSIIIKEWMFRYTKKAAKKLNSAALEADAWHHRSDALSSIGAFIGILGTKIGLTFFDALASTLIAFCIIKVSYDILKDALAKMLDTSISEEEENSIKELIKSNSKVLAIDDIKTRLFGAKMYVDVEIAVDPTLTLIEAHNIAEEVRFLVESNFSTCKHCMVHVNPKIE